MSGIHITKEDIKNFGACNFCSSGILVKENAQVGLKYPYRKVFVLTGNSLSVNICGECLKIIKKIK